MAVAATFPGAPALASTLDQRTLIEGLAAHGRHRDRGRSFPFAVRPPGM